VRDLQLLPERVAAVESHILQLRSEVRGGLLQFETGSMAANAVCRKATMTPA
jgi:hypothetical protein